MIKIARRYVQYLSERSIVDRILGTLRIRGEYPFRDHVDALEHDAFGMFFYNQRAIFFFASGLFLVALVVGVLALPSTTATLYGLLILIAAWVVGVTITLILHRRFLKQLQAWASADTPRNLPPLFDTYFTIDSGLLLLVILAGRVTGVRLDAVGYVLAANVIVYAAYVFAGHASKLAKGGVIVALFTTAFLFIPVRQPSHIQGAWFHETVLAGSIGAMLFITIFSVTLMAALSTLEHQVTRRQLELLGRYQDVLLGEADVTTKDRNEVPFGQQQFRRRLRALYRDLCSPSAGFWYRGFETWFEENHRDRGMLLLPGPYENVTHDPDRRVGIEAESGFLATSSVLLVHSLKAQAGGKESIWRYHLDLDGPAAIVPLRRDTRKYGAIIIYGDEHSPPVPRGDEQFLTTLAALIVTGLEQWQGRFRAGARKELDTLFACQSLDEVFPKAVRVLQKYLYAAGCMLIFRPDPAADDMTVVAAAGFAKSIYSASYRAGVGQTGRCASSGKTIRIDDVNAHRSEFDVSLLALIENAHGDNVTSWMAIPIGAPPRNYGVIKVVNSTFPAKWFTDEDEALGEEIGLRLQVMIELFLHIRRTEEARDAAQRSAVEARDARAVAERAARERLQDLITITHQQQGPLIAVIGALTGILPSGLSRSSRDLLEHARALVEDALTVGYGTFTTFGRMAGRDTAYVETQVDAASELRQLAARLQRTNARPDIRFEFMEADHFPPLQIDARVFTSVVYSLIHNAMKYADWNSEVTLECGFERSTGEPAVKVKSVGAPIHPSEREHIFERFRRGRSVERGKLYTGVGLGLWVARELMRAMGGGLSVELSPDFPRLSVFVIHFPDTMVARAADT